MARQRSNKINDAAHVSRNYLLALFDFSFSRYITIQMLPVVYGIMIIASAAVIAEQVAGAYEISDMRGWIYTASAPFAFIFLVSMCRAVLEFFVVVFRIAEDMEELAGMRESVDKISGLTDIASLTRRLPFVRLLHQQRRRDEGESPDQYRPPSNRQP